MDDDGKLWEAHKHKPGSIYTLYILAHEQQDSVETSLRRRVECAEVDKVTASSKYEKRKRNRIESFERIVLQSK